MGRHVNAGQHAKIFFVVSETLKSSSDPRQYYRYDIDAVYEATLVSRTSKDPLQIRPMISHYRSDDTSRQYAFYRYSLYEDNR